MNEKQIGPFIKSLREEKNLNQEQLGEILSVHRTTVNKWEKGKSIPLNDTLVLLSEFFDVSIDEILAGERFNKDDISKNNEVVLSLLTKRRKLMKVVAYIGSLLFIVTSVFLIYYFFTTYNTLHVYRVFTNIDSPYTSTGLLVLSRDKSYLKFGSVYNISNEIVNVDKIDIYFKDDEDKINMLYTGSIKNTLIDFSYGNHNLNIKDLNSNNYDFCIKIYFEDQVEELKLYVDKDFDNKALIYNEENILLPDNMSKTILENIKNNKKFIYDESNYSYVYQTKNLKIDLFTELNLFSIYYYKNKVEEKYIYDLLTNTLEYRKLNNGVISDEKFIELNNIITGDEKKIFNDFKKNYIDKYLK